MIVSEGNKRERNVKERKRGEKRKEWKGRREKRLNKGNER